VVDIVVTIKLKEEIMELGKELTIEFFKWCNTPIYMSSNGILRTYKLRVVAQFPEYDSYIVIDSNGRSVLPDGKFLTAEELYDYWVETESELKQLKKVARELRDSE